MSQFFTPFSFKGLTIRNRSMRSATAERMSTEDRGLVTEKLIQHYEELAKGGVGLIITGHMYVHRAGKCHPEMTSIASDEVIPGLRKIAKTAHAHGAKIIPQINFGGMSCSKEVNELNWAPSHIEEVSNQVAPNREISQFELALLVDAYAQAARRAKEAGFDGVMLHGAHGYFITQTLSPLINKRDDQWGGSFDGRLQFLRSVCSAIRNQIGSDFPLLIKFGMMDGKEGGLSLEDGLKIVSQFETMGIDGIEISFGWGVGDRKTIRGDSKEATFLNWARAARKVTNLPIFLVDGFRSLPVMEEALQEGSVDVISMCKPLICEPDLINQFEAGVKTKADCISCNRCFAQQMNQGTRCRWKEDRLKKMAG
ncbi:MAG: NADH:flavin oxidoreductase [Anaerolineaceae bacterium]|nr:NADH:flavin oxidoreductase [Anaerolineaceae bacterium]